MEIKEIKKKEEKRQAEGNAIRMETIQFKNICIYKKERKEKTNKI